MTWSAPLVPLVLISACATAHLQEARCVHVVDKDAYARVYQACMATPEQDCGALLLAASEFYSHEECDE